MARKARFMLDLLGVKLGEELVRMHRDPERSSERVTKGANQEDRREVTEGSFK